jgi:VanZ family protein
MREKNAEIKKPKKTTQTIIIILLAIIAVLLSVWPNFHPEKLFFKSYSLAFDCFLHGGFYFMASLILNKILHKKINFLFVSFFLIGISVFFETVQLLVPGRSFTLMDIASNVIGVIIGGGFFMVSIYISNSRLSQKSTYMY